jgi:hypothetical protein
LKKCATNVGNNQAKDGIMNKKVVRKRKKENKMDVEEEEKEQDSRKVKSVDARKERKVMKKNDDGEVAEVGKR